MLNLFIDSDTSADAVVTLVGQMKQYRRELQAIQSDNNGQQATQVSELRGYLREALLVWLVAGEKINYSAQDNDILTAIGFRPDAASRDDNCEKFTPAQNLNYTRRRAELAVQ